MSLQRVGNGPTFDEILSDLQELISSLESDATKANRRRRTSKENRAVHFNGIIEKSCVDTKRETPHEILQDSPGGARSDLRNHEFNLRFHDNETSDIHSSHIPFPNGDASDEVTHNHRSRDLMNIAPVNKSHHHQNEHIGMNDVKNAGEAHYEENNREYIVVTASCKPSTSKQEPPEDEFPYRDEVCPSYQQDCNSNTESVYKNNEQTSLHNRQQASDKDTTTVGRETDSIHRSSPVIRRKAGSVPSTQDRPIEIRKSRSLDRKTTFDLSPKHVDIEHKYSSEEQHHSKTLSITRALSKRLSPFRRKSKLKPVKSLPVVSQPSVVARSDKSSHSLKLKKPSEPGEIEIVIQSESEKPTRPASLLLRHQQAVSVENSPMSYENSETRNGVELDSHPKVNIKKRKNGKFFKKSQRNRSEQSSVDSQDSDMNYTSGISEGTTDDSGAVEELRIIYDETVVMRDKKADHSARGGMDEKRPRGSPVIRRSTIGSSYSRETGSRSPSVYEQGNSFGDEDGNKNISWQNANRHSLHVLKDQVVPPVNSNQKRWSNTEDKMGKSYTISAQLMALENDRHYKTGSFKSRSIFPKSNKSGSKLTNMSLADRKKLSERTWNNMEPFIWGNLNGQRVEISEVDVLSLSESECVALQKVAEQRLREIDLGVSITVPKDESKLHGKNSTSMLRRAGVHLGGTKNKSKKEQDQVFSIPLVRVVENDQLLRLQTAWNDESDNDSSGKSSPDSSPKTSRRLSSSIESNGDQGHGGSIPPTFDSTEIKGSSPVTTPSDSPSTRRRLPGSRKTLARRCAVGLDTDTEIDDVQSKLLESLTETSTKDKKRSLLPPTMPQVPYVVQKCCAHILKHGLDVTGIFRVGGSKKRVKQLRQEFDHGVDVKIDEDYHAHDVAALLKEFFRDLPEALLTRELYSAFISTAKLTGQKRLEALRCLMWLLPMPNRDTLQQLLSFLATVAEYSEDRLESGGKTVTGNKMNVANLSVIFGPNILHRHKNNQSSGDAQFQVQSLERAEESTYVIKIVDDMIRSQKDLFMIPREIHDEILRTLQESDPDAVDFLLRRKAANYAKSPSPKFSIEKLDSPIEVVKHFPARTPETQPLASDMNNNNKNGNNSRNDQPPKFAEEANYRKSEWSRNSYSPIESQKRAVSDETPTKKETSLYKNSLTFTEEDMKDILNGNRSVMLKSTNRNESYKQSVPDNTTHDLKGTSHKARKELQMLPFNDILPSKPSDQLKTAFPRRQGLSLADAKNTFNHKEEVPATSTVSKNNKKSSYRTKSPSPVTLRSASATSGFEDMSSTSSESLSSNRPLTPKHKRSNKIQNFLERDTGVCSDSEPSTRTRQITQPTVLKSPHVPLHSLRLHKNTQSDKSTEDNIVDMSDLVPRTFREGRRISKDDLYLTQDMRRRLQRQQSIII